MAVHASYRVVRMRTFLSYRRADARPEAEAFYRHALGRFGRDSVFWDGDSIPPDTDWRAVIRDQIERCDAVAALVGPRWLPILKERPADADVVRFELEYAHKCRRHVLVVPFGGVRSLTRADLPDALHFLTAQQSPPADTGGRGWLADLEHRLLRFAPAVAPDRQGQGTPAWWDEWNFHPTAVTGPLAAAVAGHPDTANVVTLAGVYGSGRRYLVESAVHQARRSGAEVTLGRLDLDGYETVPGGGRNYLRYRAARLGLTADAADPLAAELTTRFGELADTLDVAAAAGLLLDMTGSPQDASRLLRRTLDRPRAVPRSLLSAVLAELTADAECVVHAVNWADVAVTLQDTLLTVAAETPRLRLVVSVFDPAAARAVTRRQTVALAVRQLDAAGVRDVLAARFDNGGPPGWLVDWLDQASRGSPALLASSLQVLLDRGVFVPDAAGRWTLADTPEARAGLREEFSELVLGPVSRLYDDHGGLDRLLHAASLCGPVVPVKAVCRVLGYEDEAAEELLDAVDDGLCPPAAGAIFEDMQFSHPGFPGTPVYRFLSPVVPDLLINAQLPARREKLAGDLLAGLEKVLPADTRAAAGVYLSLVRHMQRNDRVRKSWEAKLAWWVGLDECDRLTELVARRLEAGSLTPEEVWAAIKLTEDRWPPLRRLALIDAYARQPDGIPVDERLSYLAVRMEVLWQLARFTEANTVAREGLRACGHPESEHAGPFHTCIGVVAQQIADFGTAEYHLSLALATGERVYGPDHPTVAIRLNNLAELLEATGRLAVAEPLLRRAVAILERARGPDHPDVALMLNNLAGLLDKKGRSAEAEPLHRRALAIRERVLGPDHPDMATTLINLSLLLSDTGSAHEVESLLAKALSVVARHRLLQNQAHPRETRYISNYVEFLASQGHTEEQIHQRIDQIIAAAEVGRAADTPLTGSKHSPTTS